MRARPGGSDAGKSEKSQVAEAPIRHELDTHAAGPQSEIVFRVPLTIGFLALLAGCATTSPSHYGMGHRSNNDAEVLNGYAPFLAMGMPGYSLRITVGDEPLEERTAHGLAFSVPFLVHAQEYRHGGAFTVGEYLRPVRIVGRATYRLRLFSSGGEDPILHSYLGVGGLFDSRGGGGVCGESVWLIGDLGKGNLAFSAGYEFLPTETDHLLEFSLIMFVPYIFR